MRNAIYALVILVPLSSAILIGRYFAGHAGTSLALQKACATAAVKLLHTTAGNNYMTHYNSAQNRCFVLVKSAGLVNDGDDMYAKSTITAVSEHIEYGSFYGTKKRAAVQYTPALCRMLEDDGRFVDCKTTSEWEAFAKRLMNE